VNSSYRYLNTEESLKLLFYQIKFATFDFYQFIITQGYTRYCSDEDDNKLELISSIKIRLMMMTSTPMMMMIFDDAHQTVI